MTPAAKEILDSLKAEAKELWKVYSRACDDFRSVLESRLKPHADVSRAFKEVAACSHEAGVVEQAGVMEAYVKARKVLNGVEKQMRLSDQAKTVAGEVWSAKSRKIEAVEELQRAMVRFRAEFPCSSPLDFEL